MHRVFRLRHLLTMAALLLLGVLPVYAVCRPLGAADSFAVAAAQITANAGSTTTVTAPTGTAGQGAGAVVGAAITNAAGITAAGGITTGAATLDPVLTDLGLALDALATDARLTGTELPGTFPATSTLTPGIYEIPLAAGPATLPAGATLTLSGAGDYVILVDTASFTIGDNASIVLANGANPANVLILSSGDLAIGMNANLAGKIIGADSTTVAGGLTLNGRLYDFTSLTLSGTNTINDAGAGPTVTFTPAGATQTVAVGNTLTLGISGTDPDPTGNTTLSVSSTPALPGSATFTPVLPQTGAAANTSLSFTPVAGQEGTYAVTFTVLDESGAVCTETVNITVTGAGGGPTFVAPTPAAGATLFACPGQALNFIVQTQGASAGDLVALSQTGAPAGTVFTPTLPTAPTANAVTQVSFTPVAGQLGQTFPIVFSAQVGADPAVTRTVNVSVVNAPALSLLTAGGTPIAGSTVNATVGQQVQFRVRGTDADAGDAVSLSASGAPAGTTFNPTLPASANPVETLVSFTPAAAGTSTITFTGTDVTGCATTQVVTINAQTAGAPATITFVRTPTGNIVIGQEVCFTATVLDAGGQPVPNTPVTFVLDPGTTGASLSVGPLNGPTRNKKKKKVRPSGTNKTLVVNTNNNGQAQVCFTPFATGTATLTATAGAVSSPGGAGVVPVGAGGGGGGVTVGAHAKGAGVVDGSGFGFDVLGNPLEMTFNLDLRTKADNRVRGNINVITSGSSNEQFRGRARFIDTFEVFEDPLGVGAIITGNMETNQFGLVPFEVQILDAGTPGVPSDQFLLILDPGGLDIVAGGNLRHYRNSKVTRFKHDIAIRVGVPSVGIKN